MKFLFPEAKVRGNESSIICAIDCACGAENDIDRARSHSLPIEVTVMTLSIYTACRRPLISSASIRCVGLC